MRIILGAAILACAITLNFSSCSSGIPLPDPATKAAPRYDAAFWETWGDGFAEVSTYELVMPRYGEPRDGESIMIFVSETFSESQRVKADAGRHSKADEFPVMKLNWQKNFQTGIYDYSEMLSSFLGLVPPLSVLASPRYLSKL